MLQPTHTRPKGGIRYHYIKHRTATVKLVASAMYTRRVIVNRCFLAMGDQGASLACAQHHGTGPLWPVPDAIQQPVIPTHSICRCTGRQQSPATGHSPSSVNPLVRYGWTRAMHTSI